MIGALRDYGAPVLLAAAVHGLVVAALWVGWRPMTEPTTVIKPQLVVAKLIVMEPPRPKAQPRAAPTPKSQPRAEPRPQPKPEPKAQPTPAQDEAAERRAVERRVAEQRSAAEAERERRRVELATSSFDLALAEESEALAGDAQEQVAQSYAQGIYQLIVANWSRPPSARNGMQARLIVELVPTGDVVAVTVVDSSGNDAFDRSAEQAVRKVGKFEVPDDPAVFEKYFRRFPVLFRPEDLLR